MVRSKSYIHGPYQISMIWLYLQIQILDLTNLSKLQKTSLSQEDGYKLLKIAKKNLKSLQKHPFIVCGC